MDNHKCNFCGSEEFEQRRINYLYEHGDHFLLVPNTPVEVCVRCGMEYYDAKVLEEIERHFFAIQQHREAPDRVVKIPIKAYSA